MNDRLAAANAALNANRPDEAIPHLEALLQAEPGQPVQVWRSLVVQMYRTERWADGEAWARRTLERFPRDFDTLNTLGVLLRKQKRQAEALEVLDDAVRVAPNQAAGHINRGNVLLDLNEAVKAEAVFSRLVRSDPRNPEHQRQLGRALHKQGKLGPAMVRFRQAITLKKDYVDAWLDMIGIYNEDNRKEEANALLEKALLAAPEDWRLLEGKAIVMRRAGEFRNAEAYLLGLMPARENEAWLHYQLGGVISDYARERANVHMRRSVELAPDKLDYTMSLVESLERTRTGNEGANIEESYQLAIQAMVHLEHFSTSHTKVIREVLIRVCDFDRLEMFPSFAEVGRGWATSNKHTALLKQLARVGSDADRLELLEQHRIWGRIAEAKAAERPITQRGRRAPDGRIRLGFMSSDLRRHPVGYFALPLFDHIDRERFDVYVYSFYQGEKDQLQAQIESRITAYRWTQDTSSREAAQEIADDQLDMLIELGGSTHMNKLDVMAYRPAPRQASWLGYPHSAGLSTIDYLVCDPYCAPPRRELLVEQPLMMPHTWLALGRAVFADMHNIADGLPEERKGYITFGTANNPHKYTRRVLAAWAQVVLRTPGSKFMFVRPEGNSESFRRNILAAFAKEGVGEERVIFQATRGGHMPFYNEIDITLDPFPLTGGTTTTESLWMGVPVVSLVGEAFYERLSYSILSNAGVGHHAADSLEGYFKVAADLVANREERRALRQGLRDQIRQSPLGRTEDFAKDFYDMVARVVAETPDARP